MHHNFSHKLYRLVSEILILTIIESKGKAHPYEIYNTLYNEIFRDQITQIEEFSQILKFTSNYLDFIKDPNEINRNQLEMQLSIIYSPHFQKKDLDFSDFFSIENEKTKIKDLESLIENATKFLENRQERLKIWKSKTAIYQVMKDLEEKEHLIEILETEIVKGRIRKIYGITPKGKQFALSWIQEYGDYSELISPKISCFEEINKNYSNQHSFHVLSFLENIIHKDLIDSLLLSSNNSAFSHFLKHIFPLIGKPSRLYTALIHDDNFAIKNILNEIPTNYRLIYKKLLLKDLNVLKSKIDEHIKSLEESK